MNQYEGRLKKMADYMEQSNASYIKAQEELKSVRNRNEAENKLGERFI